MITDQEIRAELLDHQSLPGAGLTMDAAIGAVVEGMIDSAVSAGEYEGCSTQLELAAGEYESRVGRIAGEFRFARVRGHGLTRETLARYLPENYRAVEVAGELYAVGFDDHGWTMEDYVVPRLASGLYAAEEVVS